MNNQNDDSLAKATSEILSISEELSRLRGAVQEHSDAAGALNKLSGDLGQLAQVMQKLPDPLASVAAKGEQLVGSIEQALGPAATLVSAVNSLSDSIAKLPSEAILRELFDVLQIKIEDSSRDAASALVRMDEKFDGITNSLKRLEIFAEKQATDSVNGFSMMARELTLASEARNAALTQLQMMNDKQLGKLQINALESTRKLDVLERLARRSLFAILMGSDKDEKRS